MDIEMHQVGHSKNPWPRTILYSPAWKLLLAISGVVAIVPLVFLFVSTILLHPVAPLTVIVLVSVAASIYAVLFVALLAVADWRFLRVRPGAAQLYRYDDGPWLSLRDDPRTSMTISWITKTTRDTVVHLGKKNGELARFQGEPAKMHVVTFHGLEPGATYIYRVEHLDATGEHHEFSTAPQGGLLPGKMLSFLVIGDTQNGGGLGKQDWPYPSLMARMCEHDVDLFFHVGDATDQGNDVRSWHRFLEESSKLAAGVPMHVAVGNHDTGTNDFHDVGMKKLPDEGANFDYLLRYKYEAPPTEREITPFKGRYFSLVHSGCLFVILDTQNSKMARRENPQWAWLDKTLGGAPPGSWKFVFVHRPLLTARPAVEGDAGPRYEESPFYQFIWPVLAKHGVHAVFQGHGHYYSCITRDPGKKEARPVKLFMTGGGGNKLRPRGLVQAHDDIPLPGFHVNEHSSHYMHVAVDKDACTARAIRVDGTAIDEEIIKF